MSRVSQPLLLLRLMTVSVSRTNQRAKYNHFLLFLEHPHAPFPPTLRSSLHASPHGLQTSTFWRATPSNEAVSAWNPLSQVEYVWIKELEAWRGKTDHWQKNYTCSVWTVSCPLLLTPLVYEQFKCFQALISREVKITRAHRHKGSSSSCGTNIDNTHTSVLTGS